jgi:hypothetical protein
MKRAPWTRPLRAAAAAYALLGTVLTMVVNLVFLDVPTLEGAYARSGLDPARAHAAAVAGHTGTLASTTVLCALYVAVGIGAWRRRRWAFWVGLLVYGLTGAGVLIVPARDTGLSATGLLLTLVNDGLAAILFGWMLIALIAGMRRRSDRPPS